MASAQQNIAVQAFDAIDQAQRAVSLPELEDVFARTLRRWGVDYFVALRVADPLRAPRLDVEFGRPNLAWQAHYQSSGHAARDPAMREMIRSSEPMFWSELPGLRGGLKPEESRVLEEARSFGLHEAFLAPLHNPDGSISAVLLAGERMPAADAPHTRTAMHLIGLNFGRLGRKLRRSQADGAAPIVKLSARQAECLMWVLQNKSSSVIAELMHLSARTVDEYIAAACRKLGVYSRNEAANKAAKLGLLSATTQ